MIKEPSISQYLLSTCLFIIDEFNEMYANYTKPELKKIADIKFNEMDIAVRIGYPFRQMVHYTVGDKKDKGASKSNHDLFVESKDFKIEVKFLKNWNSSSNTSSNSALWKPFQDDFDWLFKEIDENKKNKRAFVIGWFNCVDYFAQLIQLGVGSGQKPLANEHRISYFPFLRKLKTPTYTSDLVYDYASAYSSQTVKLIGERSGDYQCLFLGNENDVFHFAIYY
jgi:hypothetical protein